MNQARRFCSVFLMLPSRATGCAAERRRNWLLERAYWLEGERDHTRAPEHR
jgi:hypothetical protein